MSAAVARTVAQAKINLFLHVLAREGTGYHQLETLFQRLALGDDVLVRADVAGRALDCRGADVGPTEQNLAWRAAEAYRLATGWPAGFDIEIDKRVPVGGGMGGGSADAGAVLRCLNALAPRPIPAAALLTLGAALGADVPFLSAECATALAWGRGERLLALPALPAREVLLATFAEGVSTRDAFAWLATSRGDGSRRARALIPGALESWESVAALAANDFEEVVLPRRRDVDGVLATLRAQAAAAGAGSFALLAGSGATVFAVSGASLDGWEVTAASTVRTHTVTAVAPVRVGD